MMHRMPPPDPSHVHFDRVIYCAACGFAVENELTKLDTRVFHVECFVCHQCRESLVGKQVHIKDGKNFDEKCYALFASNICDICCKPILGENEQYIKAKGKTYHDDCYVCSQCGNTLRKKRYHVDGDKRICQVCVTANRFGPATSSEPSNDGASMGEEL